MRKQATKTSFIIAAIVAAASLSGPAHAGEAGSGGVAGVEQDGRWAVMAGSNLRSTLEGWSSSADWTVIWDSPMDYRIRASASFSGNFEDVVGRLVDAIYQSNPELYVTMYRGNRVVHVQHMATATN